MKVRRLLFAFVFLALIFTGQAGSARSLADSSGSFELVSVATDGTIQYGALYYVSISADGRYVAFVTDAKNLGDCGWGDDYYNDVFVHDRQTGITECVSFTPTGEHATATTWPILSADGRFVGFTLDAYNVIVGDPTGLQDAFIRDRQTGTTEMVSVALDGGVGNNKSYIASISADGRYVAFTSLASNLVSKDTNGKTDVFVRDRVNGITTRVTVGYNGGQSHNKSGGGSLSADGRYIAFWSASNNLVSGDTNGAMDIFVRDLISGTTERVSVASDGSQGLKSGSRTYEPVISPDGRYVAFVSDFTNLVPGDTNGLPDVFVHDRQTGTTELISQATDGRQGNKTSYQPSISADGRYVTFVSGATNLISGDHIGGRNTYLRDRQTGTTVRITMTADGAVNGGSNGVIPTLRQDQLGGNLNQMSADARYVAFAGWGNYAELEPPPALPNAYVYTRPEE